MIQVHFFLLYIGGLPLYVKEKHLRSSHVDFQGGYIKMKLQTHDELEYILQPNVPTRHHSYLVAVSHYSKEQWKEWKLIKQNPGIIHHISC